MELKCTQTLLVALLDGLLDESLDVFVSLEEAVLELTGLFSTHPEDPWQTLPTWGTKHNGQPVESVAMLI